MQHHGSQQEYRITTLYKAQRAFIVTVLYIRIVSIDEMLKACKRSHSEDLKENGENKNCELHNCPD